MAGEPGAELGIVADARLPGGAVVDMHCHSSDLSLDSGVRAERLVAQAAARGLDGVCLTEHNQLWDADKAREIGERHGVAVLPGMEIGSTHGHVLVFGLDRYHPELTNIERLREIVLAEGGAMVWAHPMREGDHPTPKLVGDPGPVRGAGGRQRRPHGPRRTATGRPSPRSWESAARPDRTRTASRPSGASGRASRSPCRMSRRWCGCCACTATRRSTSAPAARTACRTWPTRRPTRLGCRRRRGARPAYGRRTRKGHLAAPPTHSCRGRLTTGSSSPSRTPCPGSPSRGWR